MDMRDGLDEQAIAPEAAGEPDEPLFDLGGDERRMHVRAYNHWVSLLKGRAVPLIDDLDPAGNLDFGPHGVLLDFGDDVIDPHVRYLGSALAHECGIACDEITRVAEVPPRSLLSRLTDHYLQIIANKAPIGFEAEFVSTRGRTTLYRGILMPFASGDGAAIDVIYGVINWKEVADAAVQASLDVELDASLRARLHADAPAWADGPGAEAETPLAPMGSLADTLMLARETAAAVRAADTRSRAALYRALGRAHDFALAADKAPEALARLLDEAGVKVQARSPLTALAKLVFGVDHDKTRLTEIATVLAHAQRHQVPEGGLPRVLEATPGGIKGIVADERAARRPVAPRAEPTPIERRASLATLSLDTGAAAGDAVVLLGRAGADGTIEIVATSADPRLAGSLLKRL